MSQHKPPPVVDLDIGRIDEILRHAQAKGLPKDDLDTIRGVFESYAWLTDALGRKNASIGRLLKMLFGDRTEKTAHVLGRQPAGPPAHGDGTSPTDVLATALADEPRAKGAGHGRNGAKDFPAATHERVPHESQQPGDACPECGKGTLYAVPRPGVLIRFVGQPPVQVTVYELQKLRCQLCGRVLTAQPPAAAGDQKYAPTAVSTIALLKYGSGLPFNRLQGLQRSVGVPLAAATQWRIVEAATPSIRPAYEEMIRQAAQGEVVYHDDTTVKILALMGKRAQAEGQAHDDGKRLSTRKGLFTSGVVATRGGLRMSLFFSGSQHAGENLKDVLKRRAGELAPPIQMCDALSRNMPSELRTIVANCLAHARRQFVEIVDNFPAECRHVLQAFQEIYRHDALARQENLSPAARLAFHQEKSRPVMDDLHAWLKRQYAERLVEPNSGLGAAINYLLKHWERLTLFLREAGAPLDNNICERALKKAILHRKNALFYKTQHGADVGDMYMSLIHTCELNGANPFDYLTQLQHHAAKVAAAPGNWLPWNYRANLEPPASA
jgi:transposase